LGTNRISPQFHCVYDNDFSTVHSAEGEPPAEWNDMLIYNRFKSDYDDTNFVPDLDAEWLTPVELATRQQLEESRRQTGTTQNEVPTCSSEGVR
jgi:hypothetical protein